jgi:anti-anti-sigma factor
MLVEQTEKKNGVIFAKLIEKEFTVYNAQAIQKEINEMFHDGSHSLVLDMDNVAIIDSMAIGIMVQIFIKMQRLKGSLGLLKLHPELVRLTDMSHAWYTIPAFEDPRAALIAALKENLKALNSES